MSDTTIPSDPAVQAVALGKRYRITVRPGVERLTDRVTEALAARRDTKGAPVGATGADHDPRTVWALRDVSFEVAAGRILGVIGRNGSGKTTLLKILARVTAPTEGHALVRGRVAALLSVGAGMHPLLTGRDNIALSGAILGMSRQEIDERFGDIVAFSGVERFLDEPVKHYSSGMYVRLAFSVAAHLPSEVILIDEVLSAGDAEFQRRSEAHMREMLKDGRSVIYVGHNLGIVRSLCDEALVLDAGAVRFRGSPADAVSYYGEEIVGR